jgi:dipeptidyl aminopeptidase/acylaminoacyl peptidase
MKTFSRKLMDILIYIAIALLLLSLWGFYLAIRPFKITSDITPSSFNIPYESVSFETSDHVRLKGWFIKCNKPNAKTIILMHGYPADKGNILPATLFLHQHYNLLYFDFRYLGESDGHYSTIGKDEVKDLQAAIRFLRSRNISEVGIYGFSLGGAVAIMAAPSSPEVKAIVTVSSYARLDWMARDYFQIPLIKYLLGDLSRIWGLLFLQYDINAVSPALYAREIKIPVLIMHSRDDNLVTFDHALLLQESLKNNPHTETIFYNGGDHGELVKNHNAIVTRFFDNYLSKKPEKSSTTKN